MEYKLSEKELKELGFNKSKTIEGIYTCILGKGEPFLGWSLPEMVSYFPEHNLILFKNDEYTTKSFKETKALLEEFKSKIV